MCPGGGAFDSLFCPEGRAFVHNDCPGGRVFAPFKSFSRGGGMVLDEIDTCIRVTVSSACIKQRQLKIERMPTVLTCALSWALSGFGNTFKLEKRLTVLTIGIASNLCNSG